MNALALHAEQQLKEAGFFDKDNDHGGLLAKSVINLIELFSEQGHSGASASATISLFERLASFKVICPIKDEPEEWVDTGRELQHKRDCSVFKSKETGKIRAIHGYSFSDDGGKTYFTYGKFSPIEIELPCIPPETVYLKVPKEHDDIDFENAIKEHENDKKQMKY